VHVWRVGKDATWVELVIEGPPGSFYQGMCRVCHRAGRHAHFSHLQSSLVHQEGHSFFV
jgi:hypothetical protein